MSPCRTPSGVLPWILVLACVPACLTPEEYLEQADEEAYALVDARRDQLFAEGSGFTIEPHQDSLRQRILRGEWDPERELDLLDFLDIAAENSRNYQTQKEALYLAALDLTLEQWRLGNIYGVGGSAGTDGVGSDTNNRDVSAGANLSRLLGSGGTLLASIGSSLFQVVSTGDGWDAVTDLTLSFSQPLLRSAGRRVTLEPLTQAERDLIYQVRDFERFRRTFAVDVATQVYDLLLAENQLENQERNYQNLVDLRRRNEAYAEAGELSQIQADQARQDELRSENDLLVQRASFQRRLDSFKLFLGLPIDTPIQLDTSEFSRIQTDDELLDEFDLGRAVDVARIERLDFRTTLDRFEDRQRKLEIARNALLTGLDLDTSAVVGSSDSGGTSFDADDIAWNASLSFDLPIQRIPERNAYRSSLISLEVARRNVEQDSDQIELSVRDAIRVARNARISYQIQVGASTLAVRRVESSRLNLEGGEASTRDVLESEEALRNARNSRSSALVNYALARLDLYLELEALRISEEGIGFDAGIIERVRSAE